MADVAWRKGILMIEGASAVENLAHVTHIVMDKTGTLTEGNLRVSNFRTTNAWQEKLELLSTYICAAEENGASAHPVGAAVFRQALQAAGGRWKKYEHYGGLRDLQETAGQGIRCLVDIGDANWRSVCVGNLALTKKIGVAGLENVPSEVDALGTAVFVSIDGQLAASIVLQVRLFNDINRVSCLMMIGHASFRCTHNHQWLQGSRFICHNGTKHVQTRDGCQDC